MKAKLISTYIYTSQATKEYKEFIEKNKGMWVEIDTTWMFDNQYNVGDFRIYDTHIERIEDDVRTDKSVFFVNHPNGKDDIKDVSFIDTRKNKRYLSCYSVNGNYYRVSRHRNIEFILADGKVYITNGIGYERIRDAELSRNEKMLVMGCVKRINEIK